MRVNGSHLRALLAVREDTTYQELAENLEIGTSYANTIVAELVEQGLLEKDREGRTVTIAPSDSKAVELLHRLEGQHSYIDWEELLAGKAVEILFYLDEPHTASELAERSGNYRNTVYRILSQFQERGIISKDGNRYTVPDEFDLLVQFAQEYVHHSHRNTVRDASSRATIIWEDTAAFLIQTPDTIDESGYHPTGPAGFEEFGLPLLTTEDNYYFHTDEDWKLDPASLVCHTLLIDDGARYRGYCLLLIAHADVDTETLQQRAQRYGVTEAVEALITFLENEGTDGGERMPMWEDLTDLTDQYG